MSSRGPDAQAGVCRTGKTVTQFRHSYRASRSQNQQHIVYGRSNMHLVYLAHTVTEACCRLWVDKCVRASVFVFKPMRNDC